MKGLSKAWCVLILCAVCVTPAFAQDLGAGDDDAWDPGSNWLTARAGYAKSTIEGAGFAGYGYGFAFAHHFKPFRLGKRSFMRQFSFGGFVHHEVMGRLGSASEVEVLAMVELTRHFHWGSSFHPYVGIGGGPVYRKLYRTGQDTRLVKGGGFLSGGVNLPITPRNLLNIDVRVYRVDGSNIPPNPVFGAGSAEEITDASGTRYDSALGSQVSVKVGYTIAY